MALLPASPVSPEIPGPGGTFEQWAAITAHLCDVPSQVPTPIEAEWQRWAQAFVISQETGGFQIPHPLPFTTWQAWAAAAKNAVSGA